MRIGIMSDTHGFLDRALFDYFSECDEIWHAGDVGNVALLDALREKKPVRAVHGNVDGTDLRMEAPKELEWTCEGVRCFMTHIGDAKAKKRLAEVKPDLFVCGHSHILRVGREPALGGMLWLNPGACGNQGWHRVRTVLRMTLAGGKASEVEAIELGPRGGVHRGNVLSKG